MRTPKPMSRPTSAMMSPKPSVIAPSVSVKPTPVASPRYSAPMIRAMTGSSFPLMMSATMPTMAIAVCRMTTRLSCGCARRRRRSAPTP